MQNKSYCLKDIAQIINAELKGDPDTEINGVGSLEHARPNQISFLVSTRYQMVATSRYQKFLQTTKAAAVIISPVHESECRVAKLITEDPDAAFVKLASLFVRQPQICAGIHPSTVVGAHCDIHRTASIGPNCVVGDHCQIGENTKIEANTIIQDGAKIGKNGVIASNVSIYHDVVIGDCVVIHAGAVIGKEGFGMVRSQTGWNKIPHLGTVMIGNNVEVGANTTIDRGSLDNTILENGVKLDNQIQIAHGVKIGENTVIAGCTGIAGSTQIGKNCMIGGAVCISDNLVICDNVIFTGMAQVAQSIRVPGVYSSGTGTQPVKIWRKNIARFRDLDNLAKKIKKIDRDSS